MPPQEAAEASWRVSDERDEVSERLAGVAVKGVSRHRSSPVVVGGGGGGGIGFGSESFEAEECDALAVASVELRRAPVKSTSTEAAFIVLDEAIDVCGTAARLSSGAPEIEAGRVAVGAQEAEGAAAGG